MKILSLNDSRSFMRRAGTSAFLFFLAKGLMWLAAPFLFLWIT